MNIKDFVKLIDSDNYGEIKNINGNKVDILLENGFIVKVNKNKIELATPPEPIKKTPKKIRLNIPPPIVDLHIEKLISDFKGMSNAEIILIQLDEFERSLDSAIASGMFEITFVHGVGAGRLRDEIRERLKQNKQIKSFMDAHFNRGSTIVKII